MLCSSGASSLVYLFGQRLASLVADFGIVLENIGVASEFCFGRSFMVFVLEWSHSSLSVSQLHGMMEFLASSKCSVAVCGFGSRRRWAGLCGNPVLEVVVERFRPDVTGEVFPRSLEVVIPLESPRWRTCGHRGAVESRDQWGVKPDTQQNTNEEWWLCRHMDTGKHPHIVHVAVFARVRQFCTHCNTVRAHIVCVQVPSLSFYVYHVAAPVWCAVLALASLRGASVPVAVRGTGLVLDAHLDNQDDLDEAFFSMDAAVAIPEPLL